MKTRQLKLSNVAIERIYGISRRDKSLKVELCTVLGLGMAQVNKLVHDNEPESHLTRTSVIAYLSAKLQMDSADILTEIL